MSLLRSTGVSALADPIGPWFSELSSGTPVGPGTAYQFGTAEPGRATHHNWTEHLWHIHATGSVEVQFTSHDPVNYPTEPLFSAAWEINAGWTPATTVEDAGPAPDLTAGDVAIGTWSGSLMLTDSVEADMGTGVFLAFGLPDTDSVTIRLIATITASHEPPVYRYWARDITDTNGTFWPGLSYWASVNHQIECVISSQLESNDTPLPDAQIYHGPLGVQIGDDGDVYNGEAGGNYTHLTHGLSPDETVSTTPSGAYPYSAANPGLAVQTFTLGRLGTTVPLISGGFTVSSLAWAGRSYHPVRPGL